MLGCVVVSSLSVGVITGYSMCSSSTAHLLWAVNLPCTHQACTVNRLPHSKSSRDQADKSVYHRAFVCEVS